MMPCDYCQSVLLRLNQITYSLILDDSSREGTPCNPDDDDDDETMEHFLPSSSVCNGDIRSASSSNKRCHNPNRHHHRSRSRMPQIVLIPQQSHPLSSSAPSINPNFPSHYELFNSNMYLLERHLKHLITKQKNEEDRNEIINEWKLMALIMDRLFFWLFASLTLLSTLFCLIIIPYLKNAGFIPALAKDLLIDLKLTTESLTNIIQEQIKTNLTSGSFGREK
jgi:hypothetical protein